MAHVPTCHGQSKQHRTPDVNLPPRGECSVYCMADCRPQYANHPANLHFLGPRVSACSAPQTRPQILLTWRPTVCQVTNVLPLCTVFASPPPFSCMQRSPVAPADPAQLASNSMAIHTNVSPLCTVFASPPCPACSAPLMPLPTLLSWRPTGAATRTRCCAQQRGRRTSPWQEGEHTFEVLAVTLLFQTRTVDLQKYVEESFLLAAHSAGKTVPLLQTHCSAAAAHSSVAG
jgi:hypothetical protein